MTQNFDLVRLEARHDKLEHEIKDEYHRPIPDQSRLTELKRAKLQVKEKIAALQGELQIA